MAKIDYSIDFPLFVARLTPPFLRKERNMNFFGFVTTAIQKTHELFLGFVDDKEVEKYTTGQTFSLEKYLNYFFDRSSQRIYITHVDAIVEYDFNIAENQVADYDFFISENQPNEGVLYLRGEGNRNLDVDFLVYVPTTILTTNQPQIRAYINKYKLAGKRYRFVTI